MAINIFVELRMLIFYHKQIPLSFPFQHRFLVSLNNLFVFSVKNTNIISNNPCFCFNEIKMEISFTFSLKLLLFYKMKGKDIYFLFNQCLFNKNNYNLFILSELFQFTENRFIPMKEKENFLSSL